MSLRLFLELSTVFLKCFQFTPMLFSVKGATLHFRRFSPPEFCVFLLSFTNRIPLRAESIFGPGHFAKRVAVSFPEAAEYFSKENCRLDRPADNKWNRTSGSAGWGLRIFQIWIKFARYFYSRRFAGAEMINNILLDALPRLIKIIRLSTRRALEISRPFPDRRKLFWLTINTNPDIYLFLI